MDLLAYLRILRRRWTLILAVVAVGAILGTGSALLDSAATDDDGGSYHKATHVLFLDTFESTDGTTVQSLDQVAVLATGSDMRDRLGEQLDREGQSAVERVLMRANSITSTLEITAAATNAREAEQIADTFAEELLASLTAREETRYEEDRDRILARLDQIQADIDDFDAQLANPDLPNSTVIEAQRDGLVNQYRTTYEEFQQLAERGAPVPPLSTLEIAEAVPIGSGEYQERLRRGQLGEQITRVDASASADDDEASDGFGSTSAAFEGPVARGVLGAFLGLLGGVGLALLAERLDRRIRSRDEVEEAFGAPLLAQVPTLSKAQRRENEVVSFTSPLSRVAEAHRAVRSALLFRQAADEAPAGGNGRGSGAGVEAAFLGSEGSGDEGPLVVLVTSPGSSEGKTTTTANLAAVFAEAGNTVLAVNCDFRRPTLHLQLGAADEPRRTLDTAIPGVTLVSSVVSDPAANPAKVIAAQRQVVDATRDRFDVVLLDTAPLLTTNDAIELVSSVDAVLLVAQPNVTTVDGALRAREMLERVHAPVVGVLLVADDSVSSDAYYYYSSRQLPNEPSGAKTEVRPRDKTSARETDRLLFSAESAATLWRASPKPSS